MLNRFYQELKRRKVIRVAIVYAAVAWLMVEIASVVFPGLLLPDWSLRLVIVLALIGFPVAVVLAWAVERTPQGLVLDAGAPVPDKPAEPRKAKEGFESIAVLPFLNLSNDPDNEYFSDGMSEELLNLLCKLPQLTVASRTSSFSFKGRNVAMDEVAKQLSVDAIVEGSVRRSGDRVRITAQLIDARSDRHLWSETYNRELKDVFAVQDEIASNIVAALELNLSPAQKRSIRKLASTRDMGAYDYYLRGRYFVERGDVDSGQAMFERAIELDQGYALAWAGLADFHSWLCTWYSSTPESRDKADQCSLKALELAPELAEAHASRLHALSVNGKFAEAEAEFKSAIELDPQLYEAYYFGGRAYFAEGEFRKAADAFRQAMEIRPDDVTAATLLGTALRSLGAQEEYMEACRHGVEVAERYLALNPDDALARSRVANELVGIGDVEKGIAYAERAYSTAPNIVRYNVACVHVLVGNTERALDLLEEHARNGALHADWVEKDSDWTAVQDDPRFRAILELARKKKN